MGIFDKKSEEEKLNEKREKFMKKFGLEGLEEQDLKILDSILLDLAGTGGFLGQITSITMSPADMQKVNASWCIVRQNWMILRQLNKLNKKLENNK